MCRKDAAFNHSATQQNTLIGIKFVVLIFAVNQHLTEVKRSS